MMGTETENISLRIQGRPSSQFGDINNIHTPCTATVCSKGVSSIRLLQVLGARRRPSPPNLEDTVVWPSPVPAQAKRRTLYAHKRSLDDIRPQIKVGYYIFFAGIVCSGKVGKMLSSFFEAFKSFDVNKLKPFLKMAIQRIQIATNKKTAAVKYVYSATGRNSARLDEL